MSTPLEEYGLIGDCETAALVSAAGSIDWLCWPRFDSGACFAALLGGPGQGRCGTVEAIERQLFVDGFLLRYDTRTSVDGLPEGERAFLACSFWLADAYMLIGRAADARRLFERLLTLRNDVGLLAEEYDTRAERLVGNFPQAFSHVALVNKCLDRSLRSDRPARRDNL